MSNVLNAVKEKFKKLKQNARLRTVLICVLSLLLIFSVTFAWYINNLGLWGMEFSTGNIDFNAYVYDETGKRLIGPISPDDDDKSAYINAPLFTIENAQVGSTGTVYIAVESTGSIGVQYRVAFDVTGKTESATAYLGGYKYNISKVTDKVGFNVTGNIDVSQCPRPEKITDEIVTIDRNAINGTIENKNGYDVYRFDYTLVNKNEEYTSNSINFFLNIFATQVGGDFEDTAERGYTYYCATREDLDRAKIEAYPGDTIKLTSNIIYYGDLVFNKPINLETNDFVLTVNGNLMYDYVLGNDLRIDAGGLGQIVVQCTKEGVGGNLKIKAPLSNVTLSGSNASTGDFIVEKLITIDATNSFGAPGVTFNNTRIVDEKNSRKTILLESNTRATVSFGTTIGLIQTVVKASNIEIINNGVIGDINLSNMKLLDQTNSPQIYILNNNDINNPISLPEWSIKFEKDASGKCTGNTRIIQSYSGSPMSVTGTCPFDNDDIEVELKDTLVEQIAENNDSRLKIYYQDIDGQTTTIQSILENYLQNEATTGCKLNEVMQLEIISIGTKAITNADIAFMNSNSMLSLKHLDMQRAIVYDTNTATYDRLPNNAFAYVTKYESLILPQNLVEIGDNSLANTKIVNTVTIPAGVTTFSKNWFTNSQYVAFASSVPVAEAVTGLSGVNAIFVEEAYIKSYKNVYSTYATRIYPVSVLDETKEHFVRNLKNDEWEITYHISGEDAIIGKNITMDGTILKITSVYDNAYRHNFKLTKVDFDDTVENLGAANFYNNKNIDSVNLRNIRTLGAEVFTNCTKLSQVVFSDYLETIGNSAFMKCTSLKQDVILPATMVKIGAYAFYQTQITNFDGGGTVSIDSNAFYDCSSLVSAKLTNVELVGESGVNELFGYCTSLVSVDLSSLIKVNGSKMFQGCSSLREIYMGAKDDGVSLGTNPLLGCNTKLLKLYVPEENLSFYQTKAPGGIAASMIYPRGEKMDESLVNGFNIGKYIVMENDDHTYSLVTSNVDHSGDFTVPSSYNGTPITVIYANCFRNQNFTDVNLTIGDNVKTIGTAAFYGRNGLLKVKFGKSLETLGTYSFAYCAELTGNVVLPSTMKSIDNYALRNTKITGINTGGTTSIGDLAFASTSLVYAELPEVTVISQGGNNEVFSSCSSLVSVDMPKVAEVYGSKMFTYCNSLREIYMGSQSANVSLGSNPFPGVTTTKIKMFVPEEAVSFYKNKKILSTNQIFPRGEKLGDMAVNGFVIGDYIMMETDEGYTLVTSQLDFSGEVVLPAEFNGKPVTKIYENAFRNQAFQQVNMQLGENVTTIGTRAFYNLTGLQSITMDGVTRIDYEAFYGTGLKVLNAPQATYLGNNAFRKCKSLTIANLPVIETIEGTDVFAECSALNTVYFENVMSVSNNTFSFCYALENITINRLIEADGSNMPAVMTIEKTAPCKIYVPYRALSSYPSTWSTKPVVSFDLTVKYNGDTYILSENNEGRYTVIDFMPSKTITSLTLPATVTVDGESISIYAIGENAFATISGTLKDITLPISLAQMDNGALSECDVLENVYVHGSNPYFKAVGGILYSKDVKMLVKYPAGRSGKFDMTATSYASTIGIGAGAFANADKLTEIKFPASLLVIDSTAFTNCTKLQTVEFTGTTPPVLMGTSTFDTSVEDFKMVIPTTSSSVVNAYLCAYNFAQYEPYIDLGGNAAPGDDATRNQVFLANAAANTANIAAVVAEEDVAGAPEKDATVGDDLELAAEA